MLPNPMMNPMMAAMMNPMDRRGASMVRRHGIHHVAWAPDFTLLAPTCCDKSLLNDGFAVGTHML